MGGLNHLFKQMLQVRGKTSGRGLFLCLTKDPKTSNLGGIKTSRVALQRSASIWRLWREKTAPVAACYKHLPLLQKEWFQRHSEHNQSLGRGGCRNYLKVLSTFSPWFFQLCFPPSIKLLIIHYGYGNPLQDGFLHRAGDWNQISPWVIKLSLNLISVSVKLFLLVL